MSNHGSLFRSFLLLFAATVAAFMVLLKLDLAGKLAYSIERARLRALRETVPSPEEMIGVMEPSRRVAALVAPAVVSIETARYYSASEQRELSERMQELRRFFRGNAETNGAPADPEGPIPPGVPNDWFHRFLNPDDNDDPRSLPIGEGSGVIVDADKGYILTNNHVVGEADVIRVYLADGRECEAKLVGTDPKTDLALIHVDEDGLFAIPLGDSDQMEVGDAVFAVGNAFGLGGAFSRGIISAKGRSNVNIHGIEYRRFLQTDAVINPGNSGGPLVNMRGEIVGINTAIATNTGRYDGVGFAIPSSRIARLLPQLASGKPIIRGYLGVSVSSVRDRPDEAERLGWTDTYGLIVGDVLPGSPAERAGLHRNDILLQYGDDRLTATEDLIEAVALADPDSLVPLQVWRDSHQRTVSAQIGRQPDDFSTRPRWLVLPPPASND